MIRKRPRLIIYSIVVIFISMAIIWPSVGFSQDVNYPKGNVTLISPFGPGGSNDTLCRNLAPALQKQLGVKVLVENKPGAGGQVGFNYVYRSQPDGYTIVLVDQPTMQIHELQGATYKTLKFTQIYGLTLRSHAISVLYDEKIKNLSDLEELYSGKILNTACAGMGTTGELQVRMVSQATNLKLKPIPYRGAAKQLAALIGGHVQVAFPSIISAVPLYKDKKIRILAVLLDKRHPLLPEIPTLAEEGYPEAYVVANTGIMGPPGMPTKVVSVLADALASAVKDPQFKKWVEASGILLNPKNTSEYENDTKKLLNKVQEYSDVFKRKQ